MYCLYQIVKANHKLSDSILAGCEGTIVMIYTTPTLGYEVEFVNESLDTIEIITVKEKDITSKDN